MDWIDTEWIANSFNWLFRATFNCSKALSTFDLFFQLLALSFFCYLIIIIDIHIFFPLFVFFCTIFSGVNNLSSFFQKGKKSLFNFWLDSRERKMCYTISEHSQCFTTQTHSEELINFQIIPTIPFFSFFWVSFLIYKRIMDGKVVIFDVALVSSLISNEKFQHRESLKRICEFFKYLRKLVFLVFSPLSDICDWNV